MLIPKWMVYYAVSLGPNNVLYRSRNSKNEFEIEEEEKKKEKKS